MLKFYIALLVVLNLASLAAYWLDKSRARKHQPRISEARLLQFSFLGPVGSIFGVWWVRHKTRKFSYLWKYIVVIVASAIVHFFIARLL
jgi:uncharacterized membrane protein YsdA (DUF1294 family)